MLKKSHLITKCHFILFFISGFSGKSINLYSYAANNPIMLKDPRGKFFPFAIIASGAVGAIVGATSNLAAYYASQKMLGQEVTLGGK